MAQQFTYSFNVIFAKTFKGLSISDQDKVLDFLEIFEVNGLSDFQLYEGKISPSWASLDPSDANYTYAQANNLWHYHVGLPSYVQRHGKYKTSDWVLHFQWVHGANHIDIADMCYHYSMDGTFYLPNPPFFVKAI